MKYKLARELISFIDNSPTTFHVIENIKNELIAKGFTSLQEQDAWGVEEGKSYFVTRNNSSIIAFKIPSKHIHGFNIVASHSDSPTFKIKENADITVNSQYITLNTERYGGMIMSTWMDRPLSVAGRAIVKKGNEYISKLVNIDKELLIIPSLAIHMDRTANDGKTFNPQTDMLPLCGDVTTKDMLLKLIAENINEEVQDIISSDLYLYTRQKGCIMGVNEEYIGSPKLDDLQAVFTSLKGFVNANIGKTIPVLAVFDNEEVGSSTKQGAASTLLFDTLTRINSALGYDMQSYQRTLANSFMISADNAHAVHPNHTALADPTNKPYINKGVVIKYNANQKYTSDAVSAGIFKGIVGDLGYVCQSFANRSDLVGGSTLGNISNTNVALNTVDVGLPQLAMHSSFETAGVNDTYEFAQICERFFALSIKKLDDNKYIIEE